MITMVMCGQYARASQTAKRAPNARRVRSWIDTSAYSTKSLGPILKVFESLPVTKSMMIEH